jgi:hypothetical protein
MNGGHGVIDLVQERVASIRYKYIQKLVCSIGSVSDHESNRRLIPAFCGIPGNVRQYHNLNHIDVQYCLRGLYQREPGSYYLGT